jgi:hypothetical protein
VKVPTHGEIAIWRAAYGAAFVDIFRQNEQWSREDVTLAAVEAADRAVRALRTLAEKTDMYWEYVL